MEFSFHNFSDPEFILSRKSFKLIIAHFTLQYDNDKTFLSFSAYSF